MSAIGIIVGLAGWVFLGSVAYLIYASVKKKSKKTPAMITLASLGILVVLTPFLPETPNDSNKQVQEKASNENSKKAIEATKHEETERKEKTKENKYAKLKTLLTFEEADSKLRDYFEKVNINIHTEESPLRDGTFRKFYKASTSYIEVIGKPEVKQVSYMITPSPNNSENAEAILVLGGVLNTFCTNWDKEENGKFLRAFTEALKDNSGKKTVYVGNCKSEIIKIAKDLPITVATFWAK